MSDKELAKAIPCPVCGSKPERVEDSAGTKALRCPNCKFQTAAYACCWNTLAVNIMFAANKYKLRVVQVDAPDAADRPHAWVHRCPVCGETPLVHCVDGKLSVVCQKCNLAAAIGNNEVYSVMASWNKDAETFYHALKEFRSKWKPAASFEEVVYPESAKDYRMRYKNDKSYPYEDPYIKLSFSSPGDNSNFLSYGVYPTPWSGIMGHGVLYELDWLWATRWWFNPFKPKSAVVKTMKTIELMCLQLASLHDHVPYTDEFDNIYHYGKFKDIEQAREIDLLIQNVIYDHLGGEVPHRRMLMSRKDPEYDKNDNQLPIE